MQTIVGESVLSHTCMDVKQGCSKFLYQRNIRPSGNIYGVVTLNYLNFYIIYHSELLTFSPTESLHIMQLFYIRVNTKSGKLLKCFKLLEKPINQIIFYFVFFITITKSCCFFFWGHGDSEMTLGNRWRATSSK
jgi:hypothetical protein